MSDTARRQIVGEAWRLAKTYLTPHENWSAWRLLLTYTRVSWFAWICFHALLVSGRVILSLKVAVEDGIRAGELRLVNVHVTALSFIIIMRVLVMKFAGDGLPDVPESELVLHTVELIFDGIRAR